MSLTVTPTDICTPTEELVWKGYVYYWNDTNPYDVDGNKGYYSSSNDNVMMPNSSAKVGMSAIAALLCLVMMLFM
jgi:hypothetical protein